ncbi:MAG: hypothetical protein ACRDRH_12510 [Pseudonocardia sp.]
MVSERYLGSATDIAALLDAREAAVRPERTRHLGFGDVAAVWGMLDRLGVVEIIDEVTGPLAAARHRGAERGPTPRASGTASHEFIGVRITLPAS